MAEEIRADWRSIFQTVETDDPEWEDLEIDFISAKTLIELLSPVTEGARWDVDLELLKKHGQS